MRVLVVEDDQTLRCELQRMFSAAGFVVDVAGSFAEAAVWGIERRHDVVVLDLGLPDGDGVTLLQRWRSERWDVPVLVLTVRDAWYEKVQGIEAGADDYVTKPFHPEELMARVRALLRRSTGGRGVMVYGAVEVDLLGGRVVRAGIPVALTAKEWAVLEVLARCPGRLVRKESLRERLYEPGEDPESNTVEVFVARLRKKLPELPISTERGLGYRLEVTAERAR